MTDDRADNAVIGLVGNPQISDLAPSRSELAGPMGISARPDPRNARSHSRKETHPPGSLSDMRALLGCILPRDLATTLPLLLGLLSVALALYAIS